MALRPASSELRRRSAGRGHPPLARPSACASCGTLRDRPPGRRRSRESLVAVLLSYAVARTVTRPLAAITAAMREMPPPATSPARSRPAGRGTTRTPGSSLATFDSPHRLHRALPARGRAARAALRPRPALHRHRPRGAQPAHDHQGIAARAAREPDAAAGELREAAADIDHEVARLNRIVDDVLDFARPLRLEYAPTDVNARCAEAARGRARRRNGDPPVALPRSTRTWPRSSTDGERLRDRPRERARERPRRASAPRPTPATAAPGRGDAAPARFRRSARVAIVVEDRGLGIAATDLPHVFEPYFTTKRTGTGLGLAIAKNIVDALGGVVSARSRPGRGHAGPDRASRRRGLRRREA